jgi:hypothetical protein
MKFYITGSTRGLGKYLAEYFNCITIDRPIDLNADIDKVINLIEENSVVILNAHASQLEYVEKLKDKCKLVVCGSIAATITDSNMPKYSKEKLKLEKAVIKESLHSKHPILYLKLTSSSYKKYKLIADSINFWLDNPDITFIGYNVNE